MAWQDGNQGSGPWGRPPSGGGQDIDIQDIIQRGQERLRGALFSGGGGDDGGGRGGGMGGGRISGRALGFLIAAFLVVWLASGFYRVLPDEQGVVLRFGRFVEQTGPGLHYHLPWPVESVQRPKVTVVNRTDIGMRMSGGEFTSANGVVRDVPEESLMLTGDENIVDVDFSVFWIIKQAELFLFNIENPPGTVKAVAESTMREVVGRSKIQPILTEERQDTEEAVKTLMQETLDRYGAGIEVTQVKMQKVDPPAAVIDAFRDVQAARADQERIRNEAQAYQNKVVPEARGEAARIRNEALAYQEQTVAEAEGQAQRFLAIFREYRQAPDVTRRRMFLETMERVLGDSEKIIIDNQVGQGAGGIVPYLPLNELNRSSTQRQAQQ